MSCFEKEGAVEHVTVKRLCDFLYMIFAPSVVDVVALNFLVMTHSGLGQEYFLQGDLSILGLQTLNDIREEFCELWKTLEVMEDARGLVQDKIRIGQW